MNDRIEPNLTQDELIRRLRAEAPSQGMKGPPALAEEVIAAIRARRARPVSVSGFSIWRPVLIGSALAASITFAFFLQPGQSPDAPPAVVQHIAPGIKPAAPIPTDLVLDAGAAIATAEPTAPLRREWECLRSDALDTGAFLLARLPFAFDSELDPKESRVH
jgi:hypothetical protein